MPNTNATRSFKKSGMSKNDGGVAMQGLPSDFNSTYPSNADDKVDAEDAPCNEKYVENLPSKIEPLGAVNLGPVSLGGK